ncbi:dethiobiotin synthase [Sphingosinicella sp. CPCC 101087]|uniref:dethiobiotin synthase n=1 Tax=Sphingosinicella sp. CPCC 101087 TaxID=2497754 RepID=UPI00101E0E62|nr:dethiobiotin synthase [Sphingosinicella sp. CPCC 101087]
MRVVVAGTDTDVGKTIFSAALAGAMGAAYWKPIQAGLEEGSDSETVAALAPKATILPEAYRLTTPCSPHRAAEIDGVEIQTDELVPPPADPLVIEGAGGVLVPVTRRLGFADLFARWQLPVILVARTSLGTINHSLLSLEALRSRSVQVLGIAFCGEPQEDSEATICAIARVKRLGRLPTLAQLGPESLARAFAENFRLEDLR